MYMRTDILFCCAAATVLPVYREQPISSLLFAPVSLSRLLCQLKVVHSRSSNLPSIFLATFLYLPNGAATTVCVPHPSFAEGHARHVLH